MNQGAIVLAERAADYGRMRSVLREWGYQEIEIQRVLKYAKPENTTKAMSEPARLSARC